MLKSYKNYQTNLEYLMIESIQVVTPNEESDSIHGIYHLFIDENIKENRFLTLDYYLWSNIFPQDLTLKADAINGDVYCNAEQIQDYLKGAYDGDTLVIIDDIHSFLNLRSKSRTLNIYFSFFETIVTHLQNNGVKHIVVNSFTFTHNIKPLVDIEYRKILNRLLKLGFIPVSINDDNVTFVKNLY